jgi:hypothetical protein
MAISMPSGWPRAASTTTLSEREPSWLRSTVERAFSGPSGPLVDEAPFSNARALPNASSQKHSAKQNVPPVRARDTHGGLCSTPAPCDMSATAHARPQMFDLAKPTSRERVILDAPEERQTTERRRWQDRVEDKEVSGAKENQTGARGQSFRKVTWRHFRATLGGLSELGWWPVGATLAVRLRSPSRRRNRGKSAGGGPEAR